MSIRTSQTVGVLSAALLQAQRELENVKFDSANPHFKNKYAGLPGVVEEVKTGLNKHDIAVFQFPCEAPQDHLGLVTRLQHRSGEFMEATAIVPLPKSDPQGFGSAMTYTRRYALLSIAGLVGEPDDDANAASPSAKPGGEGVKAPPGGGFFKKTAPAPTETAKPPTKAKAGMFPKTTGE
jgi:hypothetical protein